MADEPGFDEFRRILALDLLIVAHRKRIKSLEDGLREAMEWNWLHEDLPVEVRDRFRALLSNRETPKAVSE